MNQEFYNENYYQHGIESGVSCYTNYRWIPELTIPLAMTIIDHLNIKQNQTILDYGCAKGYLVKAFRLLHRKSWGVDISEYAITHCDPEVHPYCHKLPAMVTMSKIIDYGIVKDVLEHLTLEELPMVLNNLKNCRTLFVAVPLGNNGVYTAPSNNLDKSHIICEPMLWWEHKFGEFGFYIHEKRFKIPGIKDAYYKDFPLAHGFFTLRRKHEQQ